MDLVLHPGMKIRQLNERELREFANLQDRLLDKLRIQLLAQTTIPYNDVQAEAQRILQEYAEQANWVDQNGEAVAVNLRRPRRSVLAKRVTRPTHSTSRSQRLKKVTIPSEDDKSFTDSNSRLHSKKKKRYEGNKPRDYPRPWAENSSVNGGTRPTSSISSDLSTLVQPPLSARSSLSAISDEFTNPLVVSSSDCFEEHFAERRESGYYQQFVEVQKPKDSEASDKKKADVPLPPGHLKKILAPWVDPKVAKKALLERITESLRTEKDVQESPLHQQDTAEAVNPKIEKPEHEPKMEVKKVDTLYSAHRESGPEETEASAELSYTIMPSESDAASLEPVFSNSIEMSEDQSKPSSAPKPDATTEEDSAKQNTRTKARKKKKRRQLETVNGRKIPPARDIPNSIETKVSMRTFGKSTVYKTRPKSTEHTISSQNKVRSKRSTVEMTVNHITIPERVPYQYRSSSGKEMSSKEPTDQKLSAYSKMKSKLASMPIHIPSHTSLQQKVAIRNQGITELYKEMCAFKQFKNTVNDLIDERNSGILSCANTKQIVEENHGLVVESSDINRNVLDVGTTQSLEQGDSMEKLFDEDGVMAEAKPDTATETAAQLENDSNQIKNIRSRPILGNPALLNKPIPRAHTTVAFSSVQELAQRNILPPSQRTSIDKILTVIEPGTQKNNADNEAITDLHNSFQLKKAQTCQGKPVLFDEPVIKAHATLSKSRMLINKRNVQPQVSAIEKITVENKNIQDPNAGSKQGEDKLPQHSDADKSDQLKPDGNLKSNKEERRPAVRKPVLFDEPIIKARTTIANSGMPSRSRPSLASKVSVIRTVRDIQNTNKPQPNVSYTVIPKIVSPQPSQTNYQMYNVSKPCPALVRNQAKSKLELSILAAPTALANLDDFKIKPSDESLQINKLSLVSTKSPTTGIPKQAVYTDIDLPVGSSVDLLPGVESSVKQTMESILTTVSTTKVPDVIPLLVSPSNAGFIEMNLVPKPIHALVPRVDSLIKLAKASIKRKESIESMAKLSLYNLLVAKTSDALTALTSKPLGTTACHVGSCRKRVNTTKPEAVFQYNNNPKMKKFEKSKKCKIQQNAATYHIQSTEQDNGGSGASAKLSHLGIADVLKYNILDYKFHDVTPPNMAPIVRICSNTKSNIRIRNSSTDSRAKGSPSPSQRTALSKASGAQRNIDIKNAGKLKDGNGNENGAALAPKLVKSYVISTNTRAQDGEKPRQNGSKIRDSNSRSATQDL